MPLYGIIFTPCWERLICKPSENAVLKIFFWASLLLSMYLTLKIVGLRGPLGRCQGACTAGVQAEGARATKASPVLNSPAWWPSWWYTPATYRGSPGPGNSRRGWPAVEESPCTLCQPLSLHGTCLSYPPPPPPPPPPVQPREPLGAAVGSVRLELGQCVGDLGRGGKLRRNSPSFHSVLGFLWRTTDSRWTIRSVSFLSYRCHRLLPRGLAQWLLCLL